MSRSNLITNPKFGTATTGWTPSYATLSAVTLADEGIDAPDEGCLTAGKLVRTSLVPIVESTPVAVTPGQTYAIRLSRYRADTPAAVEVLGCYFTSDAEGAVAVGQGGDYTSPAYASGWHTFQIVVKAPSDAAYAYVKYQSGENAAQTAYLTAVQMEPAESVHPYADGDTPGWSWDGTEELSASTGRSTTWDGTEAVLDAVETLLKAGMSAKLTTVAARYDDSITLDAPSTSTGYLTALIGTKGDLLTQELLTLTVPSVIILAGEEVPDTGAGDVDAKDIAGRYQTATDVLVYIRVKGSTLHESDRRLMRYCVAVQELMCAADAFTDHQCDWRGTAGTVVEIPDDDSYLLRSRGTAFRLLSFDQL